MKIPLLDPIRGYIEIALIAILLASLGSTWYYRNSLQTTKAEFALFKTQVQVLGEQAERVKVAKEAEWNAKLGTLEAQYEEAAAVTRTKFDRELARLRAIRQGGSGGSKVSGAPPTPTVCADKAGNDRLSNSLLSYREGVLGLLRSCQENTDTLIACQSFVREIR